jgi:hypothetical protein
MYERAVSPHERRFALTHMQVAAVVSDNGSEDAIG